MPQNLLMAPKANSACALHSRWFLRYSCIGWRFVYNQCAPWLMLAIASIKLIFVSGVERSYVRIRYFSAIARIDFIGVYELFNDLLW